MIGVVEDDGELASLAVEVCVGMGATAAAYTATGPFLESIRDGAPRALVLDWRLEREVGSAALMAVRHRFPTLPVVCWTGFPAWALPAMVHCDPTTRVVSKADGAAALEAAIRWALEHDKKEATP